jgi:hypothetical protein
MSGIARQRNPDCPNDPALCRITRVVAPQEPALEWDIVYDGNGNATNSDPNVYIATNHCTTCGQAWEMTWSGDEVLVTRKL